MFIIKTCNTIGAQNLSTTKIFNWPKAVILKLIDITEKIATCIKSDFELMKIYSITMERKTDFRYNFVTRAWWQSIMNEFASHRPGPPFQKALPPSSANTFLKQSTTPRYDCCPLRAFTCKNRFTMNDTAMWFISNTAE